MIRAIIIDDEQHCIERIKDLIEMHCSNKIHIMDEFKTVPEGINGINKLKPDLVFLDVEIKDQTGFDLLKQTVDISFDVIFTTGYDKYAVQAFKFSAIDYLLKPVDADDLKRAVGKLSDKLNHPDSSKKMENLLHNIASTNKRICVPIVTGFVFIPVNEIIHCESDVNYTTIYLSDKQKLMVAKTLKDFEELLGEFHFFRIHNSHLINAAYLKNYNKGKGGSVTLTDGTELEVSTRRKEDFLKWLEKI